MCFILFLQLPYYIRLGLFTCAEYSDMATKLNWSSRFCFCQFIIFPFYSAVPRHDLEMLTILFTHGSTEWSDIYQDLHRSGPYVHSTPIQADLLARDLVKLSTIYIQKHQFLPTLSTHLQKRRVWDGKLKKEVVHLAPVHHIHLTDVLTLPNTDGEVETGKWGKVGIFPAIQDEWVSHSI